MSVNARLSALFVEIGKLPPFFLDVLPLPSGPVYSCAGMDAYPEGIAQKEGALFPVFALRINSQPGNSQLSHGCFFLLLL